MQKEQRKKLVKKLLKIYELSRESVTEKDLHNFRQDIRDLPFKFRVWTQLLGAAVKQGHPEIVKVLIQKAREQPPATYLNCKNKADAFSDAACNGDKELTTLMLTATQELPQVWSAWYPDFTPLMMTAYNMNHTNTVQALIQGVPEEELEAYVLQTTSDVGRTALYLACEHGGPAMVTAILTATQQFPHIQRALVQKANEAGYTPLMIFAIRFNHAETVQALLQGMPEEELERYVLQTTPEGKTAFFLACRHRRFATATAILMATQKFPNIQRALLQKTNVEGLTPLMAAVEARNPWAELLTSQQTIQEIIKICRDFSLDFVECFGLSEDSLIKITREPLTYFVSFLSAVFKNVSTNISLRLAKKILHYLPDCIDILLQTAIDANHIPLSLYLMKFLWETEVARFNELGARLIGARLRLFEPITVIYNLLNFIPSRDLDSTEKERLVKYLFEEYVSNTQYSSACGSHAYFILCVLDACIRRRELGRILGSYVGVLTVDRPIASSILSDVLTWGAGHFQIPTDSQILYASFRRFRSILSPEVFHQGLEIVGASVFVQQAREVWKGEQKTCVPPEIIQNHLLPYLAFEELSFVFCSRNPRLYLRLFLLLGETLMQLQLGTSVATEKEPPVKWLITVLNEFFSCLVYGAKLMGFTNTLLEGRSIIAPEDSYFGTMHTFFNAVEEIQDEVRRSLPEPK